MWFSSDLVTKILEEVPFSVHRLIFIETMRGPFRNLSDFELKFFHASYSSQVGPTWNSHENSYNMNKYLVLYNKIYETHHLQWLYGARDTVMLHRQEGPDPTGLS